MLYVCVCACPPTKAKEAIRSPGAAIIGSCDLPNTGRCWNQTLALWKSNKCSYLAPP